MALVRRPVRLSGGLVRQGVVVQSQLISLARDELVPQSDLVLQASDQLESQPFSRRSTRLSQALVAAGAVGPSLAKMVSILEDELQALVASSEGEQVIEAVLHR
jgi:hypothetical protein